MLGDAGSVGQLKQKEDPSKWNPLFSLEKDHFFNWIVEIHEKHFRFTTPGTGCYIVPNHRFYFVPSSVTILIVNQITMVVVHQTVATDLRQHPVQVGMCLAIKRTFVIDTDNNQ